jgi:hypothetical protein
VRRFGGVRAQGRGRADVAAFEVIDTATGRGARAASPSRSRRRASAVVRCRLDDARADK